MIGKRSRETERLLVTMERQLDRIHTALLVRDPGTPMSVDAYEGLRKQVVASGTARLQHVAQLAEFDVALRRGASTEALLALVGQWLQQSGVERVDDPTIEGVWETPVRQGVDAVVDIPAYVDAVTHRLVRQGRLNLRPEPERLTGSTPESDAGIMAVDEASEAVDDQVPGELSSERKTDADAADSAAVTTAGDASKEA